MTAVGMMGQLWVKNYRFVHSVCSEFYAGHRHRTQYREMQGEGEKQEEMQSLKVPGQTASPLSLGSSLQLNMYLETILVQVMEELVVFSIRGG